MTLTPITSPVAPIVAKLANATNSRYLILDRVTGVPIDSNNFGHATRWSFAQRSAAIQNAHLANTQIRPAVLFDARTGETFEVTR